MGALHSKRIITGVRNDRRNRIFSTPAFMYETQNFAKIYQGIYKLVKTMKASVQKKKKQQHIIKNSSDDEEKEETEEETEEEKEKEKEQIVQKKVGLRKK